MQKLPSPRLIVSSQSAGNTTSVNYAMTAPGSATIQPGPQEFELLDLADVAVPGGRAATIPNAPERNGSGQFTGSEPVQTGGWDQAAGHGFGGWEDC